jgi:hypothetical protein
MSAFPEPDDTDEPWEAEWSPWDEMAMLEQYERRDKNWVAWVARLAAVALILPLMLGFLVAMLIWIF